VEFYSALLSFALYWNTTWVEEGGMEVTLPEHGIALGDFAKHALVREMITRRDLYFPKYGVYGARFWAMNYVTHRCSNGLRRASYGVRFLDLHLRSQMIFRFHQQTCNQIA
jgi:hypothetical protein